jgi:1-acyl-sn-glycerol-3-phosphate acyltransferase
VFTRVIARAARLLARGVYRSVEVDNPETGWSHHPAVVVANHPTGFSDPALLLGLLERSPRFLAKSTLWKTPGLGWFLDRIGAIPVYRPQDGSTTRNDEMFAAAFRALDDGATVVLFPEGRANDSPSLGPIKTGAARLSLGAHASGVRGLQIVPVGIHYEEKAAIRSRAYVRVGDVLDLDRELHALGIDPSTDAEDHEAVDELTNEIEARLRDAAPNYASDRQARRLTFASEVALREPGRFRVSFAERQRVAAALAHQSASSQALVTAATDDYRTDLDDAGLTDGDLMLTAGSPGLRWRAAALAIGLLVIAPIVVAGIVLNLLPTLALRAAVNYRDKEMTPATVRLFAAIVLFLVMWLIWATIAWVRWDWRMGLVTFIACALYGAVAVGAIDRATALWRMWSGRQRARRLGDGLERMFETRRRLVGAVETALDV